MHKFKNSHTICILRVSARDCMLATCSIFLAHRETTAMAIPAIVASALLLYVLYENRPAQLAQEKVSTTGPEAESPKNPRRVSEPVHLDTPVNTALRNEAAEIHSRVPMNDPMAAAVNKTLIAPRHEQTQIRTHPSVQLLVSAVDS